MHASCPPSFRSAVRYPALALTLLFLFARAASAATIEGVQFADHFRRGDVQMKINCVGLLRYMVFIKGYVAALYLGDGVKPEQALADVPKRLELNYFYAIKGADFGPAGEKVLAENVDTATMQSLRSRLDKISKLYEDVSPGSRYALTYIPGKGTELSLDGVSKGIIEGDDFAAAYFSIWLGKKPIDEPLRDQLLRCS